MWTLIANPRMEELWNSLPNVDAVSPAAQRMTPKASRYFPEKTSRFGERNLNAASLCSCCLR